MNPGRYAPFIERLRRLFDEMDAAYERAAAAYGFICSGCANSCCRTRFHHHTLLEYLYLREGFGEFPADRQESIRAKAAAGVAPPGREGVSGAEARPMCPLNAEGRCQIYVHRPMLCRLHGIPHVLLYPGRPPLQSPGCDEFHRRCGRPEAHRLDRTPLYTELARLESQCRQALGLRRKIRMTIAEMLLDDGVAE
jgi:Fe-S-cluster containining protein